MRFFDCNMSSATSPLNQLYFVRYYLRIWAFAESTPIYRWVQTSNKSFNLYKGFQIGSIKLNGKFSVKSLIDKEKAALDTAMDRFCFGHIHQTKWQSYPRLILVELGSTSYKISLKRGNYLRSYMRRSFHFHRFCYFIPTCPPRVCVWLLVEF